MLLNSFPFAVAEDNLGPTAISANLLTSTLHFDARNLLNLFLIILIVVIQTTSFDYCLDLRVRDNHGTAFLRFIG